MNGAGRTSGREVSRRDLLWIGTGVGIGIAGVSMLALARDLKPPASTTPPTEPLRAGDLLVFAQGSERDKPITVDRVPSGGPPVFAWPMDPKSEVVRSGRPLNIVLLVRAGDESWYSAAERPHTVARVAAFSATCTHLCCVVSDWTAQAGPHGALLCPCHKSHFDPWSGGKVLSGPAPRPLPILPIATAPGGPLVVAGGFSSPAGCRG